MPVGPRHVWVDGRIQPVDVPHLSAFDRGFQLGDGVFETLRARDGRPTELVEHVARLQRSAAGLAIHLPDDIEARLTGRRRRAAGRRGPGWTGWRRLDPHHRQSRADRRPRPVAARGAAGADARRPGLARRSRRRPTTSSVACTSIASAVRRDPENPLAALKTISRADFVYARVEARDAGADDAIFLTIDGFLSEATSANLFLVRRGELATPALACAILPGTTRDWLLAWATRVGLTPHEGWLTTRDLVEADEAFISSSVAGILPVTRFAGEPIGDGLPGRWTRQARADREAIFAARP